VKREWIKRAGKKAGKKGGKIYYRWGKNEENTENKQGYFVQK